MNTETTTAATDAALGVLSLLLLCKLQRSTHGSPWKRAVWAWIFALIAFASVLGVVVHGFALPARSRATLWIFLYLALSLSVALFLVGAVADWRRESAARALLPWMIALAVAFLAVSRLFDGAFIVFVAYEGIVMSMTLAIYASLAMAGHVSGALLVSVGIALTLVAAAVQASTLRARLIVPFDHNGLFHLIQMVAMIVVATGLRRGLEKSDAMQVNAADSPPSATAARADRGSAQARWQ